MKPLVERRLPSGRVRRSDATGVASKRVIGPEGQPETLLTVDSNSPTLTLDLLYVFQKNVDKARRRHRDRRRNEALSGAA